MFSTAVDDVQVLFLIRQQGRVTQHDLGEPENRIHRGPDFMRHVGKKEALSLIGRFSRFFCAIEFLGR